MAAGDSLVPSSSADLGVAGKSLDAGCWTPTRLDLLAWLRRNAPSLAELYEGAVLLVYVHRLPGRVRLISHAVREIRNRLPEAISGVKGASRLDYKSRMDEIASLWRDRETVLGTESRLPPDSPGVTVEGVLYHKLSELIQEHTAARTKPEEAAYRLFETVAPENRQLRESLRPIVRHWLQVTNWFMARAHDSGSVDGECDEGRLLKQFEVFETALSSLVRSFFSTLEELDEILEDTNS